MGLFGNTTKTKKFSEMSDKELIRYIDSNASLAGKAGAIKEAASRGLKNPKTGKPYLYN